MVTIKRFSKHKYMFKPTKPIEPSKIIVKEKLMVLDHGVTLSNILNFAQGQDPNLVKIGVRWYGPDADPSYVITYNEEENNSNYNAEYKKYLEDLQIYQKELDEYVKYQQDKLIKEIES